MIALLAWNLAVKVVATPARPPARRGSAPWNFALLLPWTAIFAAGVLLLALAFAVRRLP